MAINNYSKILVTGSKGLVGTALVNELSKQGYTNLCLPSRQECDLTNFQSVKSYFIAEKPEIVFHSAAAVFGIGGNLKNPAKIFFDNVLMNSHVIEASHLCGTKKIIAMGTVAAYAEPRSLPVKEEDIWEGPPHDSESSYGHAKRAMLAQLQAYKQNYGLDYAYVISTNLYGQNDKFNTRFGHVIPSLICKFYEAKKNGTNVEIWGDGSAARDFLYSKDMARALVLLMNQFSGAINVASGKKCNIHDVVDLLTDYFEMHGRVQWDTKMPNGRKFYEVDLTKLRTLGFLPLYTMKDGLLETLEWFSTTYEQNLVRM